MMREGMVVCPQHDNARRSLQHVKHYAEIALSRAFGGVTAIAAKGSWVNAQGELIQEPVWQLVSAYEPSQANDETLAKVARYIGGEGKQDAVYVRYASGDVDILDTKRATEAA